MSPTPAITISVPAVGAVPCCATLTLVTTPLPSLHRLLHQLGLGFRQELLRRLAVDRFAADFEHDRNRQRRYVVERLMDDAALDARKHFAKAPDVEQS